jgi:hypothetical protein
MPEKAGKKAEYPQNPGFENGSNMLMQIARKKSRTMITCII